MPDDYIPWWVPADHAVRHGPTVEATEPPVKAAVEPEPAPSRPELPMVDESDVRYGD